MPSRPPTVPRGLRTPAIARARTARALLAGLLAALLLWTVGARPSAAASFSELLLASPLLAEEASGPEAPSPPSPSIAPQIAVSGRTLSWTALSGVSSYVLVRKQTGQADQYSLVTGTSAAPVAAPGQTARFSVRSNISGSVWAREVSITYSTTTTPPPPPPPPPTVPVLRVSGQTLSWTAVSGVSSYVLVRKATGQADQSSVVSGTSITPPAAPGLTVRFSVRTNVAGSTLSNEVFIAYPAPPPPPPPPPPSPGGFTMGVTTGTAFAYELPFITSLGARTARLIYDIGTPASSMASVIDAYARAGVRPLLAAHFYGRLPSIAEAQSIAGWASAYGPGGTFWAGKGYPASTTVNRIEFGHETSYSYQWSDNSPTTYANRAKTYALRFKDAQVAVRAANPNVGLLAQGDNAVNQDSWVVNMFRAVPDLGSRAAGWTIHPYGPNWKTRIDSTINSTRTAGSPNLPIWVTEWGLSTDNGHCLSDNYGYEKCMTYAAAASALHAALSGMQLTYGSRLGAFFLYQAHDQYATGTRTGREAYFGALQSRGQAKGAFTTEVRVDLAAHP